MRLLTFPGKRSRPPVRIWKSTTMTSSAARMPYARRSTPKRRRLRGVCSAFGSLAATGDVVVMSSILSCGHVVHELLLGGLLAGDLPGDPSFRDRVDAI